MIRRLTSRLYHDQGLSWRALRSTAWTLLGFGGGQAVRLIVNLMLARLLFPSAFGTMALIMVMIQGLNNFSDVGTRPGILRSSRGDEPDFLNTAWTIEIIRGVVLWLACCALAVPFANFYGAPELAIYLVVAGFSTVIHGMTPMRTLTAERHMSLRQVTKADLLSQVVTSTLLIALAWTTGSVWSMVIMVAFGGIIRIAIILWMIPGHRDRLHWDRAAVYELSSFGIWIFPSTIMAFVITQGDKLILGRALSLTLLGLYNIGYFLASFPFMLGGAVMARIMIPLCRESPPSSGPEAFKRFRRIRSALTGGTLAATMLVALLGPWLVDFLYDARYQQAGIMVTLIASVAVPQIIFMGYDMTALAAGDSRGVFIQILIRAVLFLGFFWAGSQLAGLYGALIGQFIGTLLTYPSLVWLARRHKSWDPLHDAFYCIVSLVILAFIILPRLDAVRSLAQFG